MKALFCVAGVVLYGIILSLIYLFTGDDFSSIPGDIASFACGVLTAYIILKEKKTPPS